MQHPCASEIELEQFAHTGDAAPALRDHLQVCESCRQRLDDIRDNQAFLMGREGGLAKAFDAPTVAVSVTHPPPADAIPGYELIGEISRGGQGVVYRAVQSSTKREAALKMLLGGAFASDSQRARFDREIEIAASLRHPCIVTVFDSGLTRDGREYVAMEFVRGVPLDAHIRERFGSPIEGGKARVEAVMQLVRMIASAAGHAHASGVMHRDLKPSNILIDESGTPRILDFGLARAVEAVSGATMTREFVGTPAFAAPEQFAGGTGSASPATDVYALGLIAYQSLTGTMPYPVDVTIAQLAQIVPSMEPVPPSRHVPRLPADVETIVLKCLAKEPSRRYANGDALEADIADFLAGLPISAKRDSTLYLLSMLARRHAAVVAAGALVLVTVLAAAVGLGLLASDLDVARRDSDAALAASNVQRARLMASSGDLDRAEALLWSEALREGMDVELDLADAHEPRRAAWALMEMYTRLPRLFRGECDPRRLAAGFRPDGRVWFIDITGRRVWWSPLGEPIPSTPGDLVAGDDSRVSRDGRFLALRVGGTVLIRDLELGVTISGPVPWPAQDTILAISHDGKLLACARGADRVATLIDARTFQTIGEYEPVTEYLSIVRRGEQDALVIDRSSSEALRLVIRESPNWGSARTIDIGKALLTGNEPMFRGATFTKDGRLLFIGLNERVLRFDFASDPPAMTYAMDTHSPILGLDIDEVSRVVFTTSRDGSIVLRRMDDLSIINLISNGNAGIGAISPGGERVAMADDTGRFSVYETKPRAWLERIETSPVTHASIDAARDGAVAWVDDLGDLSIRDNSAAREIRTIRAHRGEATSVEWSPDGSRLLTAGFDGAVREWNRDGTPARTIIEGIPAVWSARYSPDGNALAVADGEGAVRLWRGGPGEKPLVHESGCDRVPQVEFSPDGRVLACATYERDCQILDVASGREALRLPMPGTIVRAVAFSPDGAIIATGSDDRSVRVWDARSGALLRTIDGLPWGPFDLAFHPSGRALVAAGRGPEIVVIDPLAGADVASIKIHDRLIFSVDFDPSGTHLYTSGQDPWIGVVDLEHLRMYVRGNRRYWEERASP